MNKPIVSEDFPLQQGNLDFMCGIYAAINAMYLRGEIKCLDEAAIPFRLATMFIQSRSEWDLAQATCFGIGESDYYELLCQLSWQGWAHYPDFDDDDESLPQRLKRLLKENKSQSIIISIVLRGEGEIDYHPDSERDVIHYTALKLEADGKFTPFDSQEKHQLEGDNLQCLTYNGDNVRIGSIYVM